MSHTDDWKNDWKKDRIGAAERGENPTVLAKMKSGYAVIGDNQWLEGYCVLLAHPQVSHLTDLPPGKRMEFTLDMSLLGEAIQKVVGAWRINYAIYGNYDEFLHAHCIPRYLWEPDEYRQNCPMRYPKEVIANPEQQYTPEKYGDLRDRLRATLLELMEQAGVMVEQPSLW